MILRDIPVIDLFAGPGGLGEGFASFKAGEFHPFRIAVSVEKDDHAHRTLSLRAFYRWFLYKCKKIPDDYYRHLAGECDLVNLFERHPYTHAAIRKEVLCAEIGNPNYQPLIDKTIEEAVSGRNAWLLIGGPPCQAYSLVGRSRMKNAADYRAKQGHSFEDDKRHKLYQQYLRIIAIYAPAFFVMENVKGILSAHLDGERIFPKILKDLRDPCAAAKHYKWKHAKDNRYHILSFVTGEEPCPGNDSEYLIRAEDYGVPQARHRVIVLGIRQDIFKFIDGKVQTPQKSNHLAIEKVIGMLPPLRSGFSKGRDTEHRWKNYFHRMRSAGWINTVDNDVRKQISVVLEVLASRTLCREYNGNGRFVPQALAGLYRDNALRRIPNHETRSHMDSDLDRYLFVSAFGEAHKRSPHLRDFPLDLLPDHKNVAYFTKEQKFSDRFKVQLWNEPASTITSHIAKDGHYFIHPDPAQCRSLTVREAARIQTFPDNYFFEGGRTQQYHQVGNAVPPYLAKQLAGVVWKILLSVTPLIG